ncbi:tripartite motif-containing protein 35-like [Notolabrus celidotus]|uniref:tripartite motif-containing protein 35-like n=1 Tax=Notolabrus celidotus TaxID=1203425 RepID=UPI001490178F|nr:tripartite motif-containing protein 35-like [Notolabrus celidotus]
MDFFCSVCHNIFQSPVVLSCSHSFCKDCVKRWWAGKQILLCPLCKVKSPTANPPSNLALKNLCESFLLELSLEEKAAARSEDLCSLHSEKLKLFCQDHQQPLCVVCRDSRAHTNHKFSPIEEAAEDYKKELRQQLMTLQVKVEHFAIVKMNWDQTEEHIRAQTQTTESQIREEFKKLHQFLEVEEKDRVSALRKEEEQKIVTIRMNILTLSRQIDSLSDTIKSTEQVLKSGSVPFLQNYKAAVEKVKQRPPEDPQLGPGVLIDVAKHLGNLTCNIWNNMSQLFTYSPVVLDPNTAGSTILVSKDLKSLRYKEKASWLPQNPERFELYSTVLGSKGLDLGAHMWDVEVEGAVDWTVGLIRESVLRKGDIPTGYFGLQFCDGVYKASYPPFTDEVIPVQKQLQRIRVELNHQDFQLCLAFFDLDTTQHIYTFVLPVSGRVLPFFNTVSTNPVSILPEIVNVKLHI